MTPDRTPESTADIVLDADLPAGFDPDDLDDQLFDGREAIDPARTLLEVADA